MEILCSPRNQTNNSLLSLVLEFKCEFSDFWEGKSSIHKGLTQCPVQTKKPVKLLFLTKIFRPETIRLTFGLILNLDSPSRNKKDILGPELAVPGWRSSFVSRRKSSEGRVCRLQPTGLQVLCCYLELPGQRWVVGTETGWSAKPKILTTGPFTEKVCWACCKLSDFSRTVTGF